MKPTFTTFSFALLALASTASVSQAQIVIDDFSTGLFGAETIAVGAPEYFTQAITVGADATAVRTVSAATPPGASANGFVQVSTFPPPGYAQFGQDGMIATVGWFGGLAGGFPASGAGAVTTSDVDPLFPPLDVTSFPDLEITIIPNGTSDVTATLTVYDVSLTQSDSISSGPLSSFTVWQIDIATFFSNVDPSAIGGIELELDLEDPALLGQNAGVTIGRIEATGGIVTPDPCTVDNWDTGIFSQITSIEAGQTFPAYGTQTASVTDQTGVRTVSVIADGIGQGNQYSASNTIGTSCLCSGGGGDIRIGWFGGLAGGFPTSGPGVVTISDVTPLSPPLDLSSKTTLEVPWGTGGEPLTIGTLRFRVWDATLTLSDDAPLELINATSFDSGRYVVDLSTLFSNVSASSVGGIELEVFQDAIDPNGGSISIGDVVLGVPLAAPFCDASDGSLASCPCGNAGDPDTGCDIQQGTGGVKLDVVAQQTAPSNSVMMSATGFPPASSPAAIVIRASSLDPGTPVPFGDGLRCIGTPLVRLGASFASGGASTHSFGHGTMAGSGDFYYQLWFRNTPAMFCTPDAFNLSNGRIVTW